VQAIDFCDSFSGCALSLHGEGVTAPGATFSRNQVDAAKPDQFKFFWSNTTQQKNILLLLSMPRHVPANFVQRYSN